MTSLLQDAFAHHVWATDQLLATCEGLSPEQLASAAPGTYGSIGETLRHLVASDAWYLTFFSKQVARIDEESDVDLAELQSAFRKNGATWMEVLGDDLDPDTDIEEVDGKWRVRSPIGVRLAQVVHHGTDHRSHVCSALTILGIAPPEIDVWAYARATGRERAEETRPS